MISTLGKGHLKKNAIKERATIVSDWSIYQKSLNFFVRFSLILDTFITCRFFYLSVATV